MRKAEMEAHHDEYVELERDIRAMLADREFPAIFDVCKDAFPHFVPAIQYRRREGIEPQTPRFLAIDVICQYAPPLFEHRFLDSLLDFVTSTRILAKAETGYLSMVQAAVEREEAARRLWNHVERQPGTLRRDVAALLGLDRKVVDEIADIWDHLGVFTRHAADDPARLRLRSFLNVGAEGICATCGVRCKRAWESFLTRLRCPGCGAEGFFHITYADLQ
jgi:hypothetical protein